MKYKSVPFWSINVLTNTLTHISGFKLNQETYSYEYKITKKHSIEGVCSATPVSKMKAIIRN